MCLKEKIRFTGIKEKTGGYHFKSHDIVCIFFYPYKDLRFRQVSSALDRIFYYQDKILHIHPSMCKQFFSNSCNISIPLILLVGSQTSYSLS